MRVYIISGMAVCFFLAAAFFAVRKRFNSPVICGILTGLMFASLFYAAFILLLPKILSL